ncbi:hypothetical protein LZ30DRAFT_802627 [Colletotrichum cereale]|nr:hypothetical protein LZ30DRAFT_802627 [Colletotrichum cereale]
MVILACYDPKKPTPSMDDPRGLTTVDDSSLTNYSGGKLASLACVRNSLSSHLGSKRASTLGDISPCPPPFSSERFQVNLPRLRELDDVFHPAELSNSVTYSSRSIRSYKSFPRSAMLFPKTRTYMPPATHRCSSGLSLSKATSQDYHGALEWPLVDGGFLPDWLPVTPHTGAAAQRRPRRSTSRSHCNVAYPPKQVGYISYLRDNCDISWKEVAEAYASVFSEDAKQGHKRRPQNLQGIFREKKRIFNHGQKRQYGSVGMISLPLGNHGRTNTDDNKDTGRARQRHHKADHQKRCEPWKRSVQVLSQVSPMP